MIQCSVDTNQLVIIVNYATLSTVGFHGVSSDNASFMSTLKLYSIFNRSTNDLAFTY